MTCEMRLDQHARACYHDAQCRLSSHTVAELNRRRIFACAKASVGGRRFSWPLATALGGACALALCVGMLSPQWLSPSAPMPMAGLDIADTWDDLDVLEAINLTALDEDSEFFLWLSSQDAGLLALE